MIKHYCDLGELVRRLGGAFAAAGPLYVLRDCSCRLAMHVARQHKSVGWRLVGVGLERGDESLAAPHIAAITGLSGDDNQVITAATRTRQANEQKRKARTCGSGIDGVASGFTRRLGLQHSRQVTLTAVGNEAAAST